MVPRKWRPKDVGRPDDGPGEVDIRKENKGEFHDQEDAKWIVIRGQLRGHNDMPFRQPAPGWPIGRPGSGHPQGIIGVF
jgi:hypothetical protein